MPRRSPIAISLALLSLAAASGVITSCAPVRTPGIEQFERAPEPRASINPGINEPYLAEEVDPEAWTQRFEVESREIFAHRRAIANALGLSPGDRVADVGAGTGLFVPLLAERVGPSGRVYAIDIVPAFVAHIDRRARRAGLTQVEARLCSEDSIDMPPGSVDLVFVCDTYHHFEYPDATLASIQEALAPGGELVVIEFHRIPGVSSDWVLGHVRAGRQTFTEEIEAAGFTLAEEIRIEGLVENYALRFRRTP